MLSQEDTGATTPESVVSFQCMKLLLDRAGLLLGLLVHAHLFSVHLVRCSSQAKGCAAHRLCIESSSIAICQQMKRMAI